PQAVALGLTLPDPALAWNEARGHHDFGDIDFTELFEVIKGNGPCNKQRMEQRRGAHEDGAWVRDAATAYAAKRRAEEPATTGSAA
ncbi:MAG: 1,2-phenylacetyl-CoA epoxidase subunit A, partial [Actinomycetota bacterium]|nr:1,2-phenylacetyl-CoA epoxidase subunit A [Actinomycetota bacterium]